MIVALITMELCFFNRHSDYYRTGQSISNDLHWIGEKAVWEDFADSTRTRKEWSEDEDRLILELHAQYGPRWTQIVLQLPDREANQIKNHWHAVLSKRLVLLQGDTEKCLEMRRQIRGKRLA
jgi:hypothetical protein